MANKTCFVQHQISDRMDVHYYNPEYYQVVDDLRRIEHDNEALSLCVLGDLLLEETEGVTGGQTPLGAAYVARGVPFLRVQNVRENRLSLESVVFIDMQTHESLLARSKLKPNDVLLTITGSYGLSTVISQEDLPANINQHMVRLRVDTHRIDPRYLALFLNSKLAKIQMDRLCTGSTRPALAYHAIKQIIVLFPTKLQRQLEITEKVSLTQKKGFIKIQRSEKQKKQYDQIVLSTLGLQIPDKPISKSFIINAINDRLEVKWYYEHYIQILKILDKQNAIKLSDIEHSLTFGTSVRTDRHGTIPCLQINMITRFGINLQNIRFISNELYGDVIKNVRLKQDDILITRSGSVGICAHMTSELEGYTYGSYMIRLRMSDEYKKVLLPKYLCIYLNSILGAAQFERLKTGSSQYNINNEQIKQIKVIIPDVQTQRSIIRKITTLLKRVSVSREDGERVLDNARMQFIRHIQPTLHTYSSVRKFAQI